MGDLANALGVHVRRTDKGKEAPSNLALTVESAAEKTCQLAQKIGATKVFLAADSAPFLSSLKKTLEIQGLPVVTWGSHLPAKQSKPCHMDPAIPGLEKAADAIADCFFLSRCKGLLTTYSSLSAVAT